LGSAAQEIYTTAQATSAEGTTKARRPPIRGSAGKEFYAGALVAKDPRSAPDMLEEPPLKKQRLDDAMVSATDSPCGTVQVAVSPLDAAKNPVFGISSKTAVRMSRSLQASHGIPSPLLFPLDAANNPVFGVRSPR